MTTNNNILETKPFKNENYTHRIYINGEVLSTEVIINNKGIYSEEYIGEKA